MTNYVALLRGVNLLGRSTVRMAELKAIAEELGLQKARTFIASGNLLFTSDEHEGSLTDKLQEAMKRHFGRELRVFLRTAEEMKAIARANPFPDGPGNNVQVFFLDGPPPANLLETVRNADGERIAPGTREVYVAYGEKGIGRSRVRIPAAEAGTARNMNTVDRLATLSMEIE